MEATNSLAVSTMVGPYPDQLFEGRRLESRQIVITQDEINAFAILSGDKNPIHLDRTVAQAAGLRDTIAHGALIFAKATGLAWELGLVVKSAAVFREANTKFRQFVHPGDAISIHMEVAAIRPIGSARMVTLDVKVINELGEEILRTTWKAVLRN